MADLPLDANVLKNDAPTAIAVCEAAPQDKVDAIKMKGAHVIVAGKTHVELPLLMKILNKKFSVKKLMIEGGPTLNWHMLHDRLVDEIRLIHLPFIVGGSDTPSLVGGMHIDTEDQMIRLNLKKYYMCGSNLVSEFDVLYREA
jgi:2,5-diamino-6-(ribosylamino)-4(3H)-pyrimidinone 5'-phosphate reductase